MNNNIEILVIDDNFEENEPLAIGLREEFSNVRIFSSSKEAQTYIFENLSKKFIIILDLLFRKNDLNGKEILSELRKTSQNIPIIIRTAYADQEQWTDYKDFIDKHVFAFFSRSASDYDEVLRKVKEAAVLLNAQIGTALEEWINLHEEEIKERPYMVFKNGNSYSLNQILHEIRMQTPLGKEFEKGISMLTIELITRNKEKLHD
ncbi:MAG: response regulator [Tissierellales bacterium]|nr:response regulator [Tissierellales bacterium]